MIGELLIVLQSYAEEWGSGEFWDAILGPFVDVLGIPLSALMFFGAIGVSYYAVSGRATMPVIMLILIGGVTLSFAPPSAARFGVIVLILGLAAIGYLAWREATSGP